MASSSPSPSTSSRRVILFALLGYGFLCAVILALAAALVALIFAPRQFREAAWRLGVPLVAGLLLLVIGALRIRLVPGEGRRVTPEEAPELFRVLERIQANTGAPRIDVVSVDFALNASVTELPRFGLVGPARRYLMLGLPLLYGLGPAEIEAVLAHECAHLAYRHGRRHAWLVRLSLAWLRLVTMLEASRHWGAFVFRWFFRWYGPRLEREVQALARRDEFASDLVASNSAGRRAAGRGLLRIHLLTRLLETRFWPAVRGMSAGERAPPAEVFQRLGEWLATPLDTELARELASRALDERTLDAHSHPSLTDRLRALRLLPPERDAVDAALELVLDREPRSAATALLGDSLGRIQRDVEWNWQVAIGPQWLRWHRDAAIFASPAGDASPGSADEQLVARARWSAACEEPDTAIPRLEAALAVHPELGDLKLGLGKLLLLVGSAEGRRRGISLLEEVLARESSVAIEAAGALEQEAVRLGDDASADRYRARARELNQTVLRTLGDRFSVRRGDRLRAHPLPSHLLAEIERCLKRAPEIRTGFLFSKPLPGLQDDKAVFLGLECEAAWHRSEDKVLAKVCARVAADLSLPPEVQVVVLPLPRHGSLRRRLRKLEGAECYRRGEALPRRATGDGREIVFGRFRLLGSRGWILLAVGAVAAGLLLDRSQSREPSLNDLRRAALRSPGNVEAQTAYGIALAQAKRFDEAVPVLERAARVRPNDAPLLENWAWALGEIGRREEALTVERRILRLQPNDEFARRNAPWLLLNLGRWSEAVEAYSLAIADNPGDAWVRYEYGMALGRLGREREAMMELRRAARLGPRELEIQRTFASAAANRHRYAESLEGFRRAVWLDSTDARLWTMRARAALITNRFGEAAYALLRARALDPGDSAGWRDPSLWNPLAAEGLLREPARRPPDSPITPAELAQDSVQEATWEAAVGRATTAARRVVSIRSDPARLELRLGDTLYMGNLRLTAKAEDGSVLEGFRPAIDLEPTGLVEIGHDGVLRARHVGRGVLIVAASPEDLASLRNSSPKILRVPIVVVP